MSAAVRCSPVDIQADRFPKPFACSTDRCAAGAWHNGDDAADDDLGGQWWVQRSVPHKLLVEQSSRFAAKLG